MSHLVLNLDGLNGSGDTNEINSFSSMGLGFEYIIKQLSRIIKVSRAAADNVDLALDLSGHH